MTPQGLKDPDTVRNAATEAAQPIAGAPVGSLCQGCGDVVGPLLDTRCRSL